ncbi:MAG: class I SAM-dependent methyltransferase [Lachnospiraceae bacterium]|jgi:tRNA (adenine22-N1)-methyltransferase|nr:class I SAM-dependent methyltransferase [Lachnospiraceae bacterium]
MAKITLSRRLQTLAHMVTSGHAVCDVGCDHAHAVIYLVEQGISPRGIAMDINNSPLERAAENIAARNLADKIDVRLSDGLAALQVNEVEAVIIAGLGGILMQSILAAAPEKTGSLAELVLQPQSELPAFRQYLRLAGFHTVAEDIVLEEGKFYHLMKVRPGLPDPKEPGRTTIADSYGGMLLESRHPVLLQYLKREHRITMDIYKAMNNNDSYLNGKNHSRLLEIEGKLDELTDLIGMWP